LPLALFNWRDNIDDENQYRSIFLLGVDDLEDIITYYIIGSDNNYGHALCFSDVQKSMLFWNDQPYVPREDNTEELRNYLRNRIDETIFPAIETVFTQCKPLSYYVEFLSSFDQQNLNDVTTHAWSRIVYGSDYSSDFLEHQVKKEKDRILENAELEKKVLSPIFNRLIGIRAVFSSFYHFYVYYCENSQIISWQFASNKFSNAFNFLYDSNLLTSDTFLRYIALDSSDNIINYRLDYVDNALGSLYAYAVITYEFNVDEDQIPEITNSIFKALYNQFKRELRPQVKEELVEATNKEINDEISKRANKHAKQRWKKISNRVQKYVSNTN
jgi:hypothetical protein